MEWRGLLLQDIGRASRGVPEFAVTVAAHPPSVGAAGGEDSAAGDAAADANGTSAECGTGAERGDAQPLGQKDLAGGGAECAEYTEYELLATQVPFGGHEIAVYFRAPDAVYLEVPAAALDAIAAQLQTVVDGQALRVLRPVASTAAAAAAAAASAVSPEPAPPSALARMAAWALRIVQ